VRTSCRGRRSRRGKRGQAAALSQSAILSIIPVEFFYDGLAARPTDGALFASRGDSLFEIDPATGVEVFWGESGTGVLSDLAFR